MIQYEWKRLLTTDRKRLLFLLLACVFFAWTIQRRYVSLQNDNHYMMSNGTVSIPDLWLFSFTFYWPYMFVVHPLLVAILTLDLFTKDQVQGYGAFLISRMKDRQTYFVSKIIYLFSLIIVYITLFTVVAVIIWFVSGIPFTGEQTYFMFRFIENAGLTSWYLYTSVFTAVFLGFSFIGLLVSVVSYFFNSTLSLALVFLLSVITNVAYLMNIEGILIFMPIMHMNRGQSNMYGSYAGITSSYYTPLFQNGFLFIGILILSFITWMSIKKDEFPIQTKMGSE